jgi:hypothetical protein
LAKPLEGVPFHRAPKDWVADERIALFVVYATPKGIDIGTEEFFETMAKDPDEDIAQMISSIPKLVADMIEQVRKAS